MSHDQSNRELAELFPPSGKLSGDATDSGAVDVKWRVFYDQVTHELVLYYALKVTDPGGFLLQVSAKNEDTRIFPPEDQPRVSSIFEFLPDQKVTHLRGALIDAKWRRENRGDPYLAKVWGWMELRGEVKSFGPYETSYTFPPNS